MIVPKKAKSNKFLDRPAIDIPLEFRDRLWTPELLTIARKALQENSFVYLQDLPPDFPWIGYTQQLTESLLMPQDNGKYIYDVRLVAGNENRSDSTSQNELLPHTEAAYLETPPKHLALWCDRPAACGGGITQLLDGNDLFQWEFSAAEQQQLTQRLYQYSSKDGSRKAIAPIVKLSPWGQPQLRFSYNILIHGDPSPELDAETHACDLFLKTICDRIRDRFEAYCNLIRLQQHSLLIVDNRRMLHSRTKYADRDRHLQRIWLM